jgi:predicted nucleotidyltransferase
MNVQEVIEKLRAATALSEEFPIRSLAVFGSVVRGDAGPESDVDILVEFEPDAHVGLFDFARLKRRLSEILGRSVDLATPDALHPALKDRILKEAVHAA